MALSNIWVMEIVGPAILLILLVWMVIAAPSNPGGTADKRPDEGRSSSYPGEQRRPDGVDSD